MNISIPNHKIESNISRYLKSLSKEVLSKDFPLEQISIDKLEGIQTGIPVFDNVSMSEIKFLAKNFSKKIFFAMARISCIVYITPRLAGMKGG